jgi:predicted RNase H-like nuclease (RuvC/YqgF family)
VLNKKEKVMSQKEAYEQKLEAQLREWKAKIDQLQAKADQAQADAKIDYNKHVRELRTKQSAAEQKLQALRQSGAGAWEDMKAGLDKAWNDLRHAVDSATTRFK